MPYAANADLPRNLQRILPEHAQDIFREAFNHAYAAHAGEMRREEIAHRIAWAAVKRGYEKTAAGWRRRDGSAFYC
jgi:cation transport regulator